MKCLCGRNMEETRRSDGRRHPSCGGEKCLTCGHNPEVRQKRNKMQMVPLGNGLEGIRITKKA